MNLDKIIKLLAIAHKNVDAYNLSLRAQKLHSFQEDAYQYGGATIESYYETLTKAHLKPDQTFIDLGSGIGEKVLITGLMFPYLKQAIGVEELSELHMTATMAQKILSLIPEVMTDHILFKQKNYFNVSLISTDFVYISIHPPTLEQQLKGDLLKQLNTLKQGSRVLLTQIPISSNTFSLLWKHPYKHKYGVGTMFLFEKR